MARPGMNHWTDEQGIERYECHLCKVVFTADGFYHRAGKPHSPCRLCCLAKSRRNYWARKANDPDYMEDMNRRGTERYHGFSPEVKKIVNKKRRVNMIKRAFKIRGLT